MRWATRLTRPSRRRSCRLRRRVRRRRTGSQGGRGARKSSLMRRFNRPSYLHFLSLSFFSSFSRVRFLYPPKRRRVVPSLARHPAFLLLQLSSSPCIAFVVSFILSLFPASAMVLSCFGPLLPVLFVVSSCVVCVCLACSAYTFYVGGVRAPFSSRTSIIHAVLVTFPFFSSLSRSVSVPFVKFGLR